MLQLLLMIGTLAAGPASRPATKPSDQKSSATQPAVNLDAIAELRELIRWIDAKQEKLRNQRYSEDSKRFSVLRNRALKALGAVKRGQSTQKIYPRLEDNSSLGGYLEASRIEVSNVMPNGIVFVSSGIRRFSISGYDNAEQLVEGQSIDLSDVPLKVDGFVEYTTFGGERGRVQSFRVIPEAERVYSSGAQWEIDRIIDSGLAGEKQSVPSAGK